MVVQVRELRKKTVAFANLFTNRKLFAYRDRRPMVPTQWYIDIIERSDANQGMWFMESFAKFLIVVFM